MYILAMMWYTIYCCIRASKKNNKERKQELGVGISQEKSGLYSVRFVDRCSKKQHKRFKKLQDFRKWVAEAQFLDEHCDLNVPNDMIVDE